MTKKMLRFVDVKQETPEKRETGKRKDDFNEIYKDYIKNKATEQSSRCSQCGVPFCQIHCPLWQNEALNNRVPLSHLIQAFL